MSRTAYGEKISLLCVSMWVGVRVGVWMGGCYYIDRGFRCATSLPEGDLSTQKTNKQDVSFAAEICVSQCENKLNVEHRKPKDHK